MNDEPQRTCDDYERMYQAVPKKARAFASYKWGKTWHHAEMDSLMDFAALAMAPRIADLEARAAQAEAEVERLKSGIKDFLSGNYPHPRSHRPGKCRHDVWYYDECPTCNEAHFERLLSPNRREALSALARLDADLLDATPPQDP